MRPINAHLRVESRHCGSSWRRARTQRIRRAPALGKPQFRTLLRAKRAAWACSTEDSAMQRIRLALIVSCAIVVVAPAHAADIEARSIIDSVIVYPDGAAVTRIIRADLPGGDSVLLARDFPPGLDPASLRVEGAGGARLTIGAIDARPPRAERPPLSPDLENRIEALRDERGTLDDKIAAAGARKKFAQRFADNAPA